jgi:DNA-directed RNA polymerase I and III subunit RPAC1
VTENNTVVFRMFVEGAEGPRGAGAAASAAALEGDEDAAGDAGGRYTSIFSSSLIWEPTGAQEEKFAGRLPAPVHDDILIAKLAPGQVIELEAWGQKGVGRDHAKFSPVATASYRLLPRIELSAESPFEGDEADQLVAKCPLGVFDIEDIAAAPAGASASSSSSSARGAHCPLPPAPSTLPFPLLPVPPPDRIRAGNDTFLVRLTVTN